MSAFEASSHVAAAADLAMLKAVPRKPNEASFFFHDPHFRSNAVKVLPGEYFVASQQLAITTVLGSCIAACLWDRQAGVGGMNHFMLPEGDSGDACARYGSYAMELLINQLQKAGARREGLQAKIFGGGQVMASFTTMNVGERNTHFIRDFMRTERIPVVSEDVLDIYPRKVCFFPLDGRAMVKRLAHGRTADLQKQELRGNAVRIAESSSGGSIDLF